MGPIKHKSMVLDSYESTNETQKRSANINWHEWSRLLGCDYPRLQADGTPSPPSSVTPFVFQHDNGFKYVVDKSEP